MTHNQKVTNQVYEYGKLKLAIRQVLLAHPFWTHEQVCNELGLDYRKYRNTVKKETCLFFKEIGIGVFHHRLPDGKLVLCGVNQP
jgi:hypothetical protein